MRTCFKPFISEIAVLLKLTAFRQERWGHDHVQAEFNRRLIRARTLFPSSLRTIHNDLIGIRHIADYTDRYMGERIASRCLVKVAAMDQVGKLTVFNIGGNRVRLLAAIHYNRRRVYIRAVLTHAEYDAGTWKE